MLLAAGTNLEITHVTLRERVQLLDAQVCRSQENVEGMTADVMWLSSTGQKNAGQNNHTIGEDLSGMSSATQ